MLFLGIIVLLLLLGLVGSLFLIFFSLYHSEGVSKVKMLEDALPGEDCGKCGYTNCQHFAQALTMNVEKVVDKCTIMDGKQQQHVKNLLGQYAKKDAKNDISSHVAFIACKEGGRQLPTRVDIVKNLSCSGVEHLTGNQFACYDSCIGLGECIAWCPRHAIFRNSDGRITIDTANCSGCGICASRCPKQVIHLRPRQSMVGVACSSHDTIEEKKHNCPSEGCTGCEICHNIVGGDNFTVEAVLAKRGEGLISKEQMKQLIERCPTQVIRSLEQNITD